MVFFAKGEGGNEDNEAKSKLSLMRVPLRPSMNILHCIATFGGSSRFSVGFTTQNNSNSQVQGKFRPYWLNQVVIYMLLHNVTNVWPIKRCWYLSIG